MELHTSACQKSALTARPVRPCAVCAVCMVFAACACAQLEPRRRARERRGKQRRAAAPLAGVGCWRVGCGAEGSTARARATAQRAQSRPCRPSRTPHLQRNRRFRNTTVPSKLFSTAERFPASSPLKALGVTVRYRCTSFARATHLQSIGAPSGILRSGVGVEGLVYAYHTCGAYVENENHAHTCYCPRAQE